MTHSLLAMCGGFLLAVLWMDLMFDVQVLPYGRHAGELPERVLASIAGYYLRVTTTARPMGHLVALVMVTLLVSGGVQLGGASRPWSSAAALLLAAGPIGLGLLRVYPRAVRLASRSDSVLRQSALARSICHEHLLCFAGMLAFTVLQVLAGVAEAAR